MGSLKRDAATVGNERVRVVKDNNEEDPVEKRCGIELHVIEMKKNDQ